MRFPRLAAVVAALVVAWNGAAVATAGTPACHCTPVTAFTPPPASDGPFGITAGPGGTWYAEGDQIVRIGRAATVTEYPLPDAGTADAGWLTWPGGRWVWFADRGNNRLGEIDESGRVREYDLPASPDGGLGPGGMVIIGRGVWFTDPLGDRVGRFDTATHTFTMFAVPTAAAWPLGVTLGPDGALWFIERSAGKVARMTLHGAFREWDLAPDSFPNRIVVGPDRALWFTELDAGLIGRLTVRGHLTQTPIDGGPVGITVGPDRHVYVALWTSNQLARLDDRGHVTRTWDVPGALLVAASHRALWLTNQFTNSLARVRPECT